MTNPFRKRLMRHVEQLGLQGDSDDNWVSGGRMASDANGLLACGLINACFWNRKGLGALPESVECNLFPVRAGGAPGANGARPATAPRDARSSAGGLDMRHSAVAGYPQGPGGKARGAEMLAPGM